MTNPACPLCGREKYMRRPKQLYGHAVCKKCVNAFANRRQLAFIIDVLLVRIGIMLVTFAIGIGIGTVAMQAQGELSEDVMLLLGVLDLGFAALGMLLIASRDAVSGKSPGKALVGVRAVSSDSLQPIGLLASLKRNWLVLIPFMPLVMAFQMLNGERAGDGMARTRVIWDKFASHPVFSNQTGQPAVGGAAYTGGSSPEYLETGNPYEPPRTS